MKQTQNYQLNQWEKTDRIKMEDFNQDNQKIETALDNMKALCNCQIYLTSYTGTGKLEERTFTFPHRPMAVMLVGDSSTSAFGVRGYSSLCVYVINSHYGPSISWGDNSITFGKNASSPHHICNGPSCNYVMAVFLDAAN